MRKETKEEFEKAIADTLSMREAAKHMGMSYDTFKRYANHYRLWKPNPSGKGRTKPRKFKSPEDVFKVHEKKISNHVKWSWLLLERPRQCEECGISEWNGKYIPLELDHINGNNRDDRKENLRILPVSYTHLTLPTILLV